MKKFLEDNDKFAFLILPQTYVRNNFDDGLELGNNIFAFRNSPFTFTKSWKKQLGEFKCRDIEAADLYIGTKIRSKNAMDMDSENEDIKNLVYRFFLALKISGFIRCDFSPFVISGALINKDIDVRQIKQLSSICRSDIMPIEPIDKKRLELTAKIHSALLYLYKKTEEFFRINRILQAFENALSNEFNADRLHQFVRSIEGFIYPETGKTKRQFISRTEIFLSKPDRKFIGILYDMRCKVEHLHNALECLPEEKSEADRITEANKITLIAESIARYCLSHFLLNRNIWRHFEDDDSLSAFWQLDSEERKILWGDALDLENIENSINPSKKMKAHYLIR